jgi:hypothetical protein
MPYFLNPFKKHDVSEFPGVLVPMAQAPHRRSVVSMTESKESRKDSSEDVPATDVGLTIDGLRAEVEADLAAFGVDSAYDRMGPKTCSLITRYVTAVA